jgi:tetratricopeptide (TPR) repeat protein
MSKRFSELLSEGFSSVAKRQGKRLSDVVDDVARSLGYSDHTINSWLYHGKTPVNLEQKTFLVRYCATYGRVGKDWANSLLVQARYPHREVLLDELFPERTQQSEVPHVYQNLPPRYGDFLGREADMARVIEGLDSRWPLISIEGMGGVGKTTLAIETARRCFPSHESALLVPFQAVAWVSAKDHLEQKRWLGEVLDTIARVLNFPYITQMSVEEKTPRVDKLLRANRILVIIDNFETIEDPDLESWMQTVPEPSKVLITGRYAKLRRVWDVHLRGLDESESLELIRRQANRLGLKPLMTDDDKTLLPLAHVTEGNPMAIELALGHVKRGVFTLEEMIDHLYSARQTVNNVFDYLYKHAWEMLTEEAQKLLMVMPFFVGATSEKAIGAAAGLSEYHLGAAVEQLIGMSLLDLENGVKGENRYSTHPLTRAFAEGKSLESSKWVIEARDRWVGWYKTFESEATEPNFQKLHYELSNYLNVMEWLSKNDDITNLSIIFCRVQHIMFAEGHWSSLLQYANQLSNWAKLTNNADLLRDIVQSPISVYRRLGTFSRGELWLKQAQDICNQLGNELLQAEIWLARGRLLLEQLFQNPDLLNEGVEFLLKALEIFQRCSVAEKTIQILNTIGNFYLRSRMLEEASKFYHQGLSFLEEFSEEIPTRARWSVYLRGNLGLVAGGKGNFVEACTVLEGILDKLTEYTDKAEVYTALALYELHQGNEEQAWAWREKAEQIFTRLGMTRPVSVEDIEWRQIHDEQYQG